ncbi:zinc finger and BTB domain-containing protein 49 [Eupeodes corollae]|uniref:zinc finger and BTB domain-containing protein 49 n=1 Tax=Eupeodes corollae TaxID=290404 RepID=UPI00248FAC3C|nr:zinc finger and BTB domain-containing protein 49 [Eupeodes corollae]
MFTNWLTSSSTNSTASLPQLPPPTLASTPPDIVLEVGPSPGVRFVAHSIILSMHSGYLRSAIRLDESAGSGGVGGGSGSPPDMVLFLTNVTADQFAPLLTYMYTGYLDLNVDNIFGVLLATHVLHMPRALEICRAFLSRAQSEGYLSNGHFLGSTTSNSKIIRPIASKASAPNLGFIAPPMQHVSLPSTCTPFKSLQQPFVTGPVFQPTIDELSESDTQSIAVASPRPTPPIPSERDDPLPKRSSPPSTSYNTPATAPKRQHKSKRSHDKHRGGKTTSNQQPTPLVAKEPVPVQIEVENKTIIDVASCDGPIRFRRVLNDAYGHKPDVLQFAPAQERTQQSVSFSFHQQMAKTISQRQMHSEESENSEDLSAKGGGSANGSNSKTGEIYNCVYCKHTFKSQYCYQKHAKRHLNPLSLDCASSNKSSSSVSSGPIAMTTTAGAASAAVATATASSATMVLEIEKDEKAIPSVVEVSTSELQRREVRPLDMNVQYYPCKTCGSKFPSYYFVHKHRKMCHANEENSQSTEPSSGKSSEH